MDIKEQIPDTQAIYVYMSVIHYTDNPRIQIVAVKVLGLTAELQPRWGGGMCRDVLGIFVDWKNMAEAEWLE